MDRDDVSLTDLATQIAEARAKAEAHAQALSHLHGQLAVLELAMLKRQKPPEDWE